MTNPSTANDISSLPQKLRVLLDGKRDYDIVIERDVLARAGSIIKERFGDRRLFVVRDPRVDAHYQTLFKSLKDVGLRVDDIVLPEGEPAKSWDCLQKTIAALLEAKADRHTMVLALGGGVVGDHAGFAAAMTLRGLDYIQIPTTLLAQVDSSVGGKTGINTVQGKNLVGAFHQPALVLIDTATLRTLPDREMKAGYAEIIKYAFINDPEFFEWLDKNGRDVLIRMEGALSHAIATSCASKASVVAADEREAGLRALLNFGHTFAHALEAACEYDRRLLHGEAVSIGMSLAFDVSARMGLCHDDEAARAIGHLIRMGLPTKIADIKDFPRISPDMLIDNMSHDKKATGGRLTFILTSGIGRAFATRDASMSCVREALAASMRHN
ncbi:MAG: 3-dehydroquinate synthase [Proteobacteria bacterium]|nr:3-dehydroquinate synthase [Pseudomonadota bacterium]